MGEHQPNDSRKVTGANAQMGGQSGGGQQQQFQADAAGGVAGQIREHMEVIGADGVHVGTVDAVEGRRIKLTRKDSGAGFEDGGHQGHHHYLSIGLVAGVEGGKVRLSAKGAVAYALEEEENPDRGDGL